jgi:hypothetical protein
MVSVGAPRWALVYGLDRFKWDLEIITATAPSSSMATSIVTQFLEPVRISAVAHGSSICEAMTEIAVAGTADTVRQEGRLPEISPEAAVREASHRGIFL